MPVGLVPARTSCKAVLLSLLWLALALAEDVAAPHQQPNVLLIVIDDTGFADISYNNRTAPGGPGRVHTPHIDALADSGVKLSNHYVQPICTPTRAALMTGRYPFRYGVTGFTIDATAPWGIPVNETFLPQFLQDAHYDTAMFGKWHLGFFKDAYLPMARGFDEQSGIYNALADHYTHYCGPGYDWHTNQSTNLTVLGTYSGELVRDDAVAYLRTRALQPTRPFFLYVPFQEAHSPFEAPDEYKALYPELAWNSDLQNLAGTVRRVT